MSDERARILKLLEEGKVTADQAVRLLDALKAKPAEPEPPCQPPFMGRRMHHRMAFRGIERIPDIVSEAIASAMNLDDAPDADAKRDFPDRHSLEVKNISGDVTVKGWDENRITLAFSGSGLTRASEVYDKVVVRSVSGDLDAQVPHDAKLVLTSVSGDVQVEGVNAKCVVKTVSGDADLTDCAGSVTVEAVSGDLGLERVTGELRVESESGDIDVEPVGAFSGMLVSKSGDVTLRLHSDADVLLDLKCEEDGEIDVDLGFPHEVLEPGENAMKLKLGAGSRQLKVRTHRADIEIREAKEE